MDSNYELKEIHIKNRTCYYFHNIVKIKDFTLDNILIDRKLCKNILVYNISYQILIELPLCVLDLIKQTDLLEFIMALDI